MSERVDGCERPSDLETGLDALRRNSDFRGPVEPLDDHEHAIDHLALIYESRDEQFAAAVPFIRQGLELGERCVYITEENPRDVVVAEMRAGGIDVDAALESGQLSIHDERETYLRAGRFDPDDTIAFLDETIAAGNEAFDGLRVTGEMGWVLGDEPGVEDLLEYEGKINELFGDVNAMALCQYNRERLPPEIVRDVISTHPHLIHGNRVSHNHYYTPPSEFFGPEQPDREVDRLLGTLREQTDSKVALEERERSLRRQNEIVADPTTSFEEKLHALFELGCDRFGLELGALARVDTDEDRFEVEAVSDEHEYFEPGVKLPLSETYCTAATDIRAAGSVADPEREGYDDITVYGEFGIRAYLGTYVGIDGDSDRTFFFVGSEARDEPFSDAERAFVRSMGQWVKYELKQHRRERELEQREQQYRTLAEAFPNGVVTMFDTDGRFTLAAGRAFDELPISGDEIEGQTIEEAWGEEAAAVVGPAYEDALDGEERVVDVEYADREWRVHVVPIRDENDDVFAGMTMAQDVTEQKERERFLHDAKAQLEAATEAGAVGTWEWYVPEDRFVAGASLARRFGVSPERAREGVSLDRFVSSIHPDDRERVEAEIEAALESCGEYEAEYRVRNEDGDLRWVVARGHVECDEDGAPVRFPGALTDITERKRNQRRLEETIEKLERSNERLEHFAYAASHDLQEPLRMVSSYLRMIERRYGSDLDDDGEEYLTFAINGADRMRGMIEALLEYSRVETRGEPLEPVDLDAVFEDVLDDLGLQIDASDAEIVADSLPRVDGDRRQLRQLFQNLLDNAITYSGDEPPRVRVSAERCEGARPPERSGTAAGSGDSEWIVAVCDEGIGIDPGHKEEIFEVFRRLHSREDYPGSGIGLALCQRIAERHGGEIWVESEPGEGSTFYVSLPAAGE